VKSFFLFLLFFLGAFGRVFVARYKPTDRFVALKVLSKKDLVHHDEVNSVIQERNILKSLHFPFIVSYLSSFQDNVNVYIVMEFVVGGELLLHLKYSGKFNDEKAKFYTAELILFFEYLHGQNYIYRDLKPENVLLDSMGHIKVIDFGFSKKLYGRTQSFCGTPEYMAPEMIMKLPYDCSIDFWSLGIFIYEMLTGSPPYTGRTPQEIYQKILYNKIEIPTYIDPTAKDFIKRLLNHNVEERLGHGKNVFEELKRQKWFKGIDWGRLKARDVAPPYIPPSSYEGDTSNFFSFPANVLADADEDPEEVIDQSLFQNF
jgi:serine/threonine protein kinase